MVMYSVMLYGVIWCSVVLYSVMLYSLYCAVLCCAATHDYLVRRVCCSTVRSQWLHGSDGVFPTALDLLADRKTPQLLRDLQRVVPSTECL